MDEIEIFLNNTDDLCEHCKNFIIDDLHKGINWLCESEWCDLAAESYLDCHKKELEQHIRLLKLKKLESI